MSSTVTNDSDGTIVVDLATVQPWHGLSPADHVQLRGEILAELSGTLPSTDDDLTSKEAARILGLTRPDGSPRDSFYRLVDELGGYPVPGGYRFPRERVEAFKRRGGVR